MKLILPLIFIIISGAIFFLVANPIISQVKELNTDISTYNAALANSTNLQEVSDSLITTYKGITQENKNKLDKLLPNTVNNIKFVLEVEQIANLNGMPIKDISLGSVGTADTASNGNGETLLQQGVSSLPYGVFPIEFSTEGKYDTFVLFIKDLEQNLRLMDIKSVAFSVPTQNNNNIVNGINNNVDPNIYKYDLKVETYWLK